MSSTSRYSVRSFRQAHQAIVSAVDQVLLNVRSYAAARPALRELDGQLLAHLGRQDSVFFQRLSECIGDNRERQKMLEFLKHDAAESKVLFLEFFDRYLNEYNMADVKNFPITFLAFKKTVIERLDVEEEYLLPLFDVVPPEETPKE